MNPALTLNVHAAAKAPTGILALDELTRVGFPVRRLTACEDIVHQAIELTMELATLNARTSPPLYASLFPGRATSLIGDPTRLKQIPINRLENTLQTVAISSGPVGYFVSDADYVMAPERLGTIPSTAGKSGGSGGGPASNILIAEDWPDSALLMKVYMRESPHHLTIAEDGQVAVSHFIAGNFDLILMDIEMPLMDGLTATRAIRAIERDRGAIPVPIIALSGNAGPEDLEMSHDAGCNDHIAKPISKQKLLQVISEYRNGMRPPEIAPMESPQPDGIEEPIIIAELIPGYLAALREELPALWERFAASDFKSLAALGHKLKGSGGSYGFPKLTTIGAALEHSANEADLESLTRELTDLGDYLRRVQQCDAQEPDSWMEVDRSRQKI